MKMKKMVWVQGVLLAVVIGSSVQGMAQANSPVKDDLFDGTQIFEKGASNVTEITMDPNSLGMVGGKAHNMILNVVRTYEYDQPGMYKMEDVDAFRKKVSTGDWFCSVHTRDLKHNESTDVCSKHRTDDLEEKAIITVEPKELTFIHTIRKRSADEHGELGEYMSLPGMSALAMLDPDMMVLRMHLPDMDTMRMRIDASTEALKAIKGMPKLKIDQVEIDKQIEKAQKQLKTMKLPDIQITPDVQVTPDDATKSDDQKPKQ